MEIRRFFASVNGGGRSGLFDKAVFYGVVVALCLAGCQAREPATVGLSGIVYNYSQDALIAVYIDGKDIGSMDDVKPGEVTSGGTICCFKLPANATEVEVEVKLPKGQGYKTIAKIEKWWPDLAHYGVVHILPGRKVVMQVTPSAPSPRKDLLEAQQRALGMEVKTLFKIWDGGPIERIDGKGK
uniref:DUF3304 domain-containing protein n=1 Tax=Dechloromonas aromatica (strain RCB) TaxID=159087 RepID=Q47E26_DECAR